MISPSLVVSSDLNGTLVQQHTMSDMIRIYLGQKNFKAADAVFKKQTRGTATMEEAFGVAGPLTEGLTLRQAIEYARDTMQFVKGFHDFSRALHGLGIPLVINSTGYSVTIYVMDALYGMVHGHIGNRLKFSGGYDRDFSHNVSEEVLQRMVCCFLDDAKNSFFQDPSYDITRATGEVELGIKDENAKATLIAEYVAKRFHAVSPTRIIHIGDTMGDSGGIIGVARSGGIGIAFNYNKELEACLRAEPEAVQRRIFFVDRKGEESDLRNILPIIHLALRQVS